MLSAQIAHRNPMRRPALCEAFATAGDALPLAGLLEGPTPVMPLPGLGGVWLKRDDLSAADYGGNKIRKLDFILARARERGARRLLSFGYAGSNFVAATAWHGHKLGMSTIAFLLPQHDAPYIADNLAVGLHCGAELHAVADGRRAVSGAVLRSARALLADRRLPFWIPPGGSTPLGAIGFVDAAFELRAQVRAGLLPEPRAIYVAFSSMGTVAGLALGCALAGLATRIEAVQVVDAAFASRDRLARLIRRTERELRRRVPGLPRADDALARVRIREEFFGPGYAMPTPATEAAIARFTAASGARADSAYSGKALAALYADADGGQLQRPALFWHTFNAHGRPAGVARPDPRQVPAELRRYFEALAPSN